MMMMMMIVMMIETWTLLVSGTGDGNVDEIQVQIGQLEIVQRLHKQVMMMMLMMLLLMTMMIMA